MKGTWKQNCKITICIGGRKCKIDITDNHCITEDRIVPEKKDEKNQGDKMLMAQRKNVEVTHLDKFHQHNNTEM